MCPNIQSAGILRDRKNNSGIFGMKIEEAFSLEFGENIDVETAYDLFWARIITDKRKFVCCYEGCNAAVTAANLDRLRQDMAVDPHYRDVAPEDHITGCPNSKEAQANSAKNVSEEQNRQSRRISSAMADVFEFNRPDSHFVRTKSTKVQNSLEEPAKKKRLHSKLSAKAIDALFIEVVCLKILPPPKKQSSRRKMHKCQRLQRPL